MTLFKGNLLCVAGCVGWSILGKAVTAIHLSALALAVEDDLGCPREGLPNRTGGVSPPTPYTSINHNIS